VSTIDYELSIYNIHPESGLTHYRDLSNQHENGIIDVGMFSFSPAGDEILGGTTTLKIFDITSGNIIREFNKGNKFTTAVDYTINGTLCANGQVDGVVNIFDTRNFEVKKAFRGKFNLLIHTFYRSFQGCACCQVLSKLKESLYLWRRFAYQYN